MSEKTCPICGKPTNVYMGKVRKDGLCREHAKLAKELLVIECPICGEWRETNKKCPNCNNAPIKVIDANNDNNNSDNLTCLLCGNPSNGKHFCIDCYHAYKDRSIDIRLKHLKFDSVLDDYGNLKYKCEDGRFVRSLQEQSIANTLWNLEIQYVYEEKVNHYSDDDKVKTLHPDFYLPKYKIYIEHIGFTSKKHDEITEYKKKIYEEQGKTVIFTNPENLTDFKQFIKQTLRIP